MLQRRLHPCQNGVAVATAGGSKLVPENLKVLEARFSFCSPSSFLQMKLQTWLIGG